MANDTPTTPQEDSPVESPTEIPPFMGSLVRDEEGEVVGLEEGTSLQPYRRVGITEKFLDPETGEMVGVRSWTSASGDVKFGRNLGNYLYTGRSVGLIIGDGSPPRYDAEGNEILSMPPASRAVATQQLEELVDNRNYAGHIWWSEHEQATRDERGRRTLTPVTHNGRLVGMSEYRWSTNTTQVHWMIGHQVYPMPAPGVRSGQNIVREDYRAVTGGHRVIRNIKTGVRELLMYEHRAHDVEKDDWVIEKWGGPTVYDKDGNVIEHEKTVANFAGGLGITSQPWRGVPKPLMEEQINELRASGWSMEDDPMQGQAARFDNALVLWLEQAEDPEVIFRADNFGPELAAYKRPQGWGKGFLDIHRLSDLRDIKKIATTWLEESVTREWNNHFMRHPEDKEPEVQAILDDILADLGWPPGDIASVEHGFISETGELSRLFRTTGGAAGTTEDKTRVTPPSSPSPQSFPHGNIWERSLRPPKPR